MPATPYFVDFETRSTYDLKKGNAWTYSRDPSTDVLCMAIAHGDEPVQIWTPNMGKEPLQRFFRDLLNGAPFIAHNAKFEFSIWQNVLCPKHGFPLLRAENLHDTMAMAYAMSLPGSLDGASKALGIAFEKDASGHRLMLQLSKPRSVKNGVVTWWDDPEKLQRLYDYCLQDVVVEREIYRKMLKLSSAERRVFLLDHQINHRGIPIDRAGCEAVIKAVDIAVDRANAELAELTNGRLTSGAQVTEMVTVLREHDVMVEDVASATVDSLLDADIHPTAKRILEIRKIVSKSSVKKINKMLACADDDDRVRQTMAYHGANTGRWAGRDIQPQNFPRPSLKQDQIEDAIELLTNGTDPAFVELLYGPLPEVASACLRGLIKAAPGRDFLAADFSNIEGRVLAWLAGEQWKLDAFRAFDAGTGPDLYLVAAAGIYGVPLESLNEKSPERQIGKVAELACGYQGGVGAFQSMAAIYRVEVSDEQADEIKTAWRAKHERTVQFWYGLERAAIDAVRTPGKITAVGNIRFRKAGSFLVCQLPSGRCIVYPYAEITKKPVPWSDQPKDALRYKSVNGLTRQWEWTDTYGGSLAENVTQAVARDFLAEAIVRLEAKGYPVIMHVHDEVVSEQPEGFGSLDEFEAIMKQIPTWATGCPISVAGWRGKRYRK